MLLDDLLLHDLTTDLLDLHPTGTWRTTSWICTNGPQHRVGVRCTMRCADYHVLRRLFLGAHAVGLLRRSLAPHELHAVLPFMDYMPDWDYMPDGGIRTARAVDLTRHAKRCHAMLCYAMPVDCCANI